MALKIANTAVVDDSGNFVGEFGGLVVNNRLVFDDTRCFQGDISGYVSGGFAPPSIDTIEKFSFANEASVTDVGELTRGFYGSGQSSEISGYMTESNIPPRGPTLDAIEKFPFSVDAPSSDVGELSQQRRFHAGQSSKLNGFGYTASGDANDPTFSSTIDKFPFSADASAADVGEMTFDAQQVTGHSSQTDGYTSGGFCPSGPNNWSNVINKFPFASDTPAVDAGELNICNNVATGQSSQTSGYKTGGRIQGPNPGIQYFTNSISKFPFSSDTLATDVGDLTTPKNGGAGQSSTTSGYMSGGYVAPSIARFSDIEKFPFASDTNSTDVGELSQAKNLAAGQQV